MSEYNISGAYKIILIQKNISASAVCKAMNVSAERMRQALTAKNPTIKTLAKYCGPIGINVSELIEAAESLQEQAK